MSARYDNIEQLDELRKSGAISEDEYEKEKARILRSQDEPQKTVIRTEEKSSFGSIVLGGLVLVLLLAGLYYLLMQGNAESTLEPDTMAEPELAAPPVGDGVLVEEVTVTRGNDGEQAE